MRHSQRYLPFAAGINGFLLIALLALLSGCATFSSSPPISAVPAQYDVAPNASAITLQTHNHLTLFGQWWQPGAGAAPKAVILLVHGTYVHSGFYADWAEHLTEHGYAVLGFDMRGWGQSQGKGRRGFVQNFDEYLEDLRLAWRQVRERYPATPVFLQGESLGGLVSVLSQERGFLPVDGMILNAPAIRPALEVGSLRSPNWLASATLWTLSLPGEVSPNMPVLVPGSVSEMFAGMAVDSDALVDAFKNDRHVVHTALPLGFITALEEGCTQAQDNMRNVTVPLLILQGTEDVLVPLSSSEFVMENVGSQDKTLKIYSGMSHATLHDTGHENVWGDIVTWLDARVAK